MLKNKWRLALFLSLMLIPNLVYGQEGVASTPMTAKNNGIQQPPQGMGGGAGRSPLVEAPQGNTGQQPMWDVYFSPQVIVALSSKNWQENEDLLIKELMDLNPGLTEVKIIPQGDKRSVLFKRSTPRGDEKLVIETNPAGLSADAGKMKPVDEFDVNAWLQVQDQPKIRRVSSVFRQDQTFWKVSTVIQSTGSSQTAAQEQADTPPAEDALEGGWFTRVIAHSEMVKNFQKGGMVMYFILLCSIGGLYITIERAYELRRKHLIPPSFLEGVLTKLPDKSSSHKEHEDVVQELIRFCEDHDKPIARSLKAGLFVFHEGLLGIKSAIISANHHESAILGKGINLLEVFANVAPLLGLLGTVLGMIKAFDMIALGGTGRPEVVAGGISEALITTAGGLLVGIPLLVCYHYLEGKIEATMIEVEEFCLDVIERLIRAKDDSEEA